jgi:membrane protein
MASWKDRLTRKVAEVRERYPLVDHILAMLGHYGDVRGNAQAGAITYFGFLSFFPILALAFFAVGVVALVYPDAREQLTTAIGRVLPGIVGNERGEIPLSTFEKNANAVGVIGLLGLLYSGLGWLDAMRTGLEVMFCLPKRERPNFVVGKLIDLGTLILIGVTLVVSVALTGAVTQLSGDILSAVGVDPTSTAPYVVLKVLAHLLAIAATMFLLLAMFRLLANPHLPRRALVEGALIGAVGFELLKVLADYLIALTKSSPSFQAFGIALILLVWINYFSRLVMYAAAWAQTVPRPSAQFIPARAGAPTQQPGPGRPA